jgi:integrase
MAVESRKGAENKERDSPGFNGCATAVLGIVAEYAAALGLEFSPHDLRRTCAKLCRLSGGALEQIQFLLGHASVQTTERYLGGKQELQVAVNDKLGVGLP